MEEAVAVTFHRHTGREVNMVLVKGQRKLWRHYNGRIGVVVRLTRKCQEEEQKRTCFQSRL